MVHRQMDTVYSRIFRSSSEPIQILGFFLPGDGSESRRQKQTKLIKNSTDGNDLGLI